MKIVKVKCSGQYYEGTGKLIQVMPYEVEILAPHSEVIGEIRSIIQNKLIKAALQKEFKNFKSVRTCQVIDVKPLTAKEEKEIKILTKPIDEMDMVELALYAVLKGLAIDPQSSTTIAEARWKVKDAAKAPAPKPKAPVKKPMMASYPKENDGENEEFVENL